MFHRVAALAIAAFLFSSPGWAFDAPRGVKAVKTEMGEALADPDGMTLYVYDRDRAFESKCNATCAKNWPPLEARKKDERVGRFLVIERGDGKLQWTYGGQPLYRWSKDKSKGDINGHGLAGVWRIAAP